MRIKVTAGHPHPMGLSIKADLANFAVYSPSAHMMHLGIFSKGSLLKELPMQKTSDIWHLSLSNLPHGLHYAYRKNDSKRWLIDPYSKIVEDHKSAIREPEEFDWQQDQSPPIENRSLIIYEMHVRGFTKDPTSRASHPGTYLGIIDKIPFFQKLGVNAIELLPVFDSDPMHNKNVHPETHERMPNYWGYNVCHFFAPRSWYAVHDAALEFKLMVKALHKAGIQVFLDVVYNHTGESGDLIIHMKELEEKTYYMLDEKGVHRNYTGCHNTLNCNHPVTKQMILDSLRYWVEEMHVDGFRFDLASILLRDENGNVLKPSLLIDEIGKDPILSKTKLIAEAWDASGGYHVGLFPHFGNWSEWNDKFRDTVRQFIRGAAHMAGAFADVLTGSNSIYKKTPLSGINFITAHDGFTLRDLVSYQNKHNMANGENNQDGNNNNYSANYGAEGHSENQDVCFLREKQMRNFLLALLLAQGTPMLSMNDVYGHSANGNNNPYVQDNRLSWFCWDELSKNEKIFQFISKLIAFRKKHKALLSEAFLTDEDIEWHSATPFQPNWDATSHLVAFTYKKGQRIYVCFNAYNHPVTITLPPGNWRTCINTEENWQFHERGSLLGKTLELPAYCALLAIE